ncbi:H(+)/Cl(-) exchange transporter ClcA [Aeoliella sp.]|uniref:H(+)/Cl(-) exchange transporter ClcA n=1 Tax=Aeoliella sp. TaxID=2795800 RepID=UPI003CCBA6B2
MSQTAESQQRSEVRALRIILLAFLVGLTAGALGAAFHYCLQQAFALHEAIAEKFAEQQGMAVLAAALCGAAMAGAAFVLVRRFAPETAGSGIQEIEGAVSGQRTVDWLRVLPVKFVGGVLAIGAGLVLGREGPTVHLGGSIGKMIGEKAKASPATIHILLASGAAAGLSVAFGAPLASILFVMEEMRGRFRYTFVSIHAVGVSSLTAKVVDDQVFGLGPLLPIRLRSSLAEVVQYPSEVAEFLPIFIGLGMLLGVCGAGFNVTLLSCLDVLDRCSARTMFLFTACLGGVAGALMLLAPGVVGGGETLVQSVFAEKSHIGFLLLLLVARCAMTFLSYGAGVPGGIFAPMLAIGALVGMCFGTVAHMLLPELVSYPAAFALAAMGGLFAATVRAPLTGIVLVAELTSSFGLLGPLLITCITASITAQLLGSRPIYESLLARTLQNANS